MCAGQFASGGGHNGLFPRSRLAASLMKRFGLVALLETAARLAAPRYSNKGRHHPLLFSGTCLSIESGQIEWTDEQPKSDPCRRIRHWIGELGGVRRQDSVPELLRLESSCPGRSVRASGADIRDGGGPGV